MPTTISLLGDLPFGGVAPISSSAWTGIDISAGAIVKFDNPIVVYKGAASPSASGAQSNYIVLDPAVDGNILQCDTDGSNTLFVLATIATDTVVSFSV